jgi:hypothetical protein
MCSVNGVKTAALKVTGDKPVLPLCSALTPALCSPRYR